MSRIKSMLLTGVPASGALGGGASFVPSDIAGLQLWLDASDISTLYQDAAKTTPVTGDGDVVGCWADKSGNGRDLTGATTARPTYKTEIYSGKSALLFDGSANALTNASVNFSTNAVTVFVVCTPTIKASNNWLIELNAGSNDGFYSYHGTDGKFAAASTGNAGFVYYTSSSVINGSPALVTVVIDLSTNPDTVQVRINSVLAGAGNSVNNTNNFGTRALYVGKRSSNLSYFSGHIAEVLVYNRQLTELEITQIEAYLY